MAQVKIRPATLKDAAVLQSLNEQLGYILSLKEVRANLKSVLKAKNDRLWVATTDGRVIGMLQARVIAAITLYRNGEGYAAAVDKNFRSLGVGAKLMQTMESWLKRKGCKRIMLYSNTKRTRAHALYSRLGYKQISTSVKMEKWI